MNRHRCLPAAKTHSEPSGATNPAATAGCRGRRTRLFIALWALLAAATLHIESVFGQTTSGSFRGTVTDQTGAAAPSARLRVTNTGTGVWLEAVTNGSGEYVVPNAPPGVYDLRVSLVGFETLEMRGVTLLVNQT